MKTVSALLALSLVASNAAATELPLDYIMEERMFALERCENPTDSRRDFFCGEFFALSNVLVNSGYCQRTDGAWVEGIAVLGDLLCHPTLNPVQPEQKPPAPRS